MRYPVAFTPDDNGTLLVTAPDFPEVTTFGFDDQDATSRALEAIETAIQGRIADREDIPLPGEITDRFVTLPTSTALKIHLHRAMLATGTRKADLARRLNWHPPQVDRLFNLNHESKLEQLDLAFRALGREIEIGDRPADKV